MQFFSCRFRTARPVSAAAVSNWCSKKAESLRPTEPCCDPQGRRCVRSLRPDRRSLSRAQFPPARPASSTNAKSARRKEAEAVGQDYPASLDAPFSWRDWAAPRASTSAEWNTSRTPTAVSHSFYDINALSNFVVDAESASTPPRDSSITSSAVSTRCVGRTPEAHSTRGARPS